jgi:hypothetical protein
MASTRNGRSRMNYTALIRIPFVPRGSFGTGKSRNFGYFATGSGSTLRMCPLNRGQSSSSLDIEHTH